HRLAADLILIWAVEEDLARPEPKVFVGRRLTDQNPTRRVACLDLLNRQQFIHLCLPRSWGFNVIISRDGRTVNDVRPTPRHLQTRRAAMVSGTFEAVARRS